MGRQESLVQLSGSVGNIAFYKSEDGFLARIKRGVSKSRIMSDPKFARTRENLAEFARASRAAKLFRSALSSVLGSSSDNRMTSRLIGKMAEAIRNDLVNPHGERNVIDGESIVLEGFEFNRKATLTTTFRPLISASIDRAAGTMTVDVPAFGTSKSVSRPDGATHFKLIAAGASVDFEANTFDVAVVESANLEIAQEAQESLQLIPAVTPASTHPLFLLFGIQFLQIINGVQKPLNNGAFNAMAIVKVDGGV